MPLLHATVTATSTALDGEILIKFLCLVSQRIQWESCLSQRKILLDSANFDKDFACLLCLDFQRIQLNSYLSQQKILIDSMRILITACLCNNCQRIQLQGLTIYFNRKFYWTRWRILIKILPVSVFALTPSECLKLNCNSQFALKYQRLAPTFRVWVGFGFRVS